MMTNARQSFDLVHQQHRRLLPGGGVTEPFLQQSCCVVGCGLLTRQLLHTANTPQFSDTGNRLLSFDWPTLAKRNKCWNKSDCRQNDLQDLDVGLMRIRHLHPVDLDEVEGRDLVHVGRMLKTTHHFMHCGRLPCAGHT